MFTNDTVLKSNTCTENSLIKENLNKQDPNSECERKVEVKCKKNNGSEKKEN